MVLLLVVLIIALIVPVFLLNLGGRRARTVARRRIRLPTARTPLHHAGNGAGTRAHVARRSRQEPAACAGESPGRQRSCQHTNELKSAPGSLHAYLRLSDQQGSIVRSVHREPACPSPTPSSCRSSSNPCRGKKLSTVARKLQLSAGGPATGSMTLGSLTMVGATKAPQATIAGLSVAYLIVDKDAPAPSR